MPNIPSMYDGGSGSNSVAGGADPSPANPATGTPAAPARELDSTTSTAPATAPQIAPEDAGGTLSPAEKSLKADSWGTKLYHGVLDALGGGGDVAYTRDPTSGKMIATPVATGPGTQWKKMIAGGLAGFAAGARAGSTGPGAALRMAGAGAQAGMQFAQQRDDRARDNANQDWDAAQKAKTADAQRALLSHQIAASTFNLQRDQVHAAVEDAERETNFEKVIADGGEGSADMGVFPDFQSAVKAFKETPELHDHQANGQIIPIPHINGRGMVDGIRAALVTPDWLRTKINRDLPITTRTFENGKVKENTFTIPAGSLTGEQYANMVQAQSQQAIENWSKTVDANAKTVQAGAQASEANSKARLVPSEIAKNDAEATYNLAHAAASEDKANGANFDWGPGGEKGFNSWHDKNVTPALQTERTYRLASSIYNERAAAHAAGKKWDTAGSKSIQMLSYHMANTFGNVKGARIGKDLIQKHLGARSVSDAAQVAVQKLYDGDQLSSAQWDAYFSMVRDSRDETWRTLVDDAQADGRPMDYIAVPQDLRQRWDLGPGRINPSLQPQPGQQQSQSNGRPPAQPQQLPGTGKTITLADAKNLPQYKGKTDQEITAAAQQLGYTVK